MPEGNQILNPTPRTAENAALGVGFERVLPKLKKGDKCLVWVCARFEVAVVVRRIPGPCYWAVVEGGPRRGERHIVSCGNWGGMV